MEGHIFIDGVIDEKMFQSVKQQIESNPLAEKLIIHMSSPGGSVYQGYKIYHKLKSLNIPKQGIIEGECMSIATFCIMACDTITALNPSRYMIHLPYMGLEGNSTDLENGAKELQMIEAEMIAAYKAKTGLDEEQLKAMMERETYMTAEEAKRFGFVDTVDNRTLKAYAVGTRKKMDKNIFDNLGERIASAFKDVFGNEPKAMDMQTDKGMISIQSEDGEIIGKPVTVDGAPAPDGEYKMDDGKVIVVAGGMVSEVKEAEAPAPPAEPAPEDGEKKEMQAQLDALKAEIEALKSAKAESETKLAAAEAQNNKAREAMAMFKKEVEDLRKKTIGGDEPPAGPVSHKKEPAGQPAPEWAAAMLEGVKERTGLHYFKKN